MIRAILVWFGLMLLSQTVLSRRAKPDPQARASAAGCDASPLGQPQRALGIPVRRPGSGPSRRLGKARRGGLRPDDRGALSLGERAFRDPPDPRVRPRSAGIAADSAFPRSFPPNGGCGSGSARSTGGPTCGSTAGRSAEHEGGYTPFEADISDASGRDGENMVVVRAFDPTDPACRPASRSAGTRPAPASGRRSGSKPGRRPTSPTSGW